LQVTVTNRKGNDMETTIDPRTEQGKRSRPGQGRGGNGRFLPGTSGNSKGKVTGTRNHATLLAENLLDGQIEALAGKAVELALAGDVPALRLCLERLLPVRRERSLTLQLPNPATAQDIMAGFGCVVEALARGELTPSETNSAAALLESARRALETTELARRIEELEERAEEAEADAREPI
jgi:hypothetical protein